MTWHDGRVVGILLAVAGEAAPQACTFDATTLAVVARTPLPEAGQSVRAVCWTGAHFLVAGDEAHEYDAQLRWVRKARGAGELTAPVRTAACAAGRVLLECGSERSTLLVTSLDLRFSERLPQQRTAWRGLADAGDGWVLRCLTRHEAGGFTGQPVPVHVTHFWLQ